MDSGEWQARFTLLCRYGRLALPLLLPLPWQVRLS